MLVLDEGGKPDYTEKNRRKQGREPEADSTHKWRLFEWLKATALTTAGDILAPQMKKHCSRGSTNDIIVQNAVADLSSTECNIATSFKGGQSCNGTPTHKF